MTKIAISSVVDIFDDEGTTVRPKRVAELLRDDFDVCFITRSSRNLREVDGLPVHLVRPAHTRLWNLKLFKIISGNHFDYVYCSNDWFGFLTYFFLKSFYHYKIVFEAHTIISEEFRERKSNPFKVHFFQALEKFAISHSDFVVALSENSYQFYSYNENIELVHVFVDEDLFQPNSNKLNGSREGDKVIGLIGPFSEFSNRYFLEFLEKNIDKFHDRITFQVIGKCDDRISHPQIRYTGYLDSIQEYVDVLGGLDALLVPSRVATLGPLNKIIEAMACSVPVFTTPKGIVGLYQVEPGREIYVFPEEELVREVNKHIFRDEMADVALAARRYVLKTYSKKANKDNLLKIFKRLGDKNP